MGRKNKVKLSPNESFVLPGRLRSKLTRNYGLVVNEQRLIELIKQNKVISVGDMVTSTLLRKGIVPKLAIFDFKTKRTRHRSRLIERTYPKRAKVKNKQGVIGYELWNAVRESMKLKRAAIQVVGEEDLAALACIHFAPKGCFVVYGLPGKGIEAIRVDKRAKTIANGLLAKMKKEIAK
ncbi:MAG: GTP-dependent dephospho-CoA kinase family protein [Candidatus Micrarchaeia archaeon]